MPVAELHPSAEELTAFVLGTLGEEAQLFVEAHVTACAFCQQRAAVAPGDVFVELLRTAHARTGRGDHTLAHATGHGQTPVPLEAIAVTDAFPPAVALSPPG